MRCGPRFPGYWLAPVVFSTANACAALAVVAGILILALTGTASAQSAKRYVPQLSLSVLAPVKVAFHPDRNDLLLVVNRDGRIDLLDISAPNRPLKIAEIFAAARDAAFSPAGDRIVSGGSDGTVRLWRLDGTAAAEPFTEAGRPDQIGVIGKKTLWVRSGNRLWFSDLEGRGRGELRFGAGGFVAIAPEGVMAPTGTLFRSVIGVDAEGRHIDRPGAVASLDAATGRDILLGERRWSRVIYAKAKAAWVSANAWYDSLGLWWKASLWPALVWFLIALSGALLWVFVPHRLARWAMPVVGRPKLPTWQWLTGIITLYGFLGQTRRALGAWLKRHEKAIYAANFGDRPSVKERTRYCDLGHEADIAAFVEAARRRKPTLRWIAGVGGKGKSALAFEMARRAREQARRRLVPILVDEDWSGSLSGYVASLLRVGDRAPTPAMVETLGAAGRLLVIVDALSERGAADAEDSVAEAARRGAFSKMMVTARKPCPEGASWRDFETIEVRPLTRERLPDYVETYIPKSDKTDAPKGDKTDAPKSDVKAVLARLEPLLRDDRPMSPLFARFAIEQTATDDAPVGTPLHLAMRYVEALRAGRLDLGADDMLRASGVAAFESVRDALAPREIDPQYLRGVLAKESDGAPFMNADAKGPVNPPALVGMLEDCGLIVRNPINRRLQFAYDPVAELLAAWRMVQNAGEAGIKSMINRIRAAEGSGLAMALADAEAMQTRQPASPRLVGSS